MKKVKSFMILLLCVMLLNQTPHIAAKAPDVVLDNVKLNYNTIEKGTQFTATFNVLNTSGDVLKNVYIEVPTTSFSVKNKGASFKIAPEIATNGGVQVTLDLVCNDTLSNKIPLEISYQKNNVDESTLEQIAVTFADVKTVKEVDTTTYKANFLMTSGDVSMIEAGTTATLSMTLKNTSTQNAKNIVITPELSEALGGKVSLNSGTLTPKSVEIKAGMEQTFEWSLTATDVKAIGTYPITYKIQYANNFNDTFATSVGGFIKITEGNTTSGVMLNKATVMPIELVREGMMQLTFELKNNAGGLPVNATVWVEGLSDSAFVYQGQITKKKVTLDALSKGTVAFDYLIKKNAPDGNYPYTIKASYTDKNNNLITLQSDYLVYLKPTVTTKGTLEIQNMTTPKAGVSGEKTFQVSFDLVNTGDQAIENIEVNYNATPEVWAQSQSIIQVKSLAKGETKHLTYSLMSGKQTESKNFPITFAVSYDAKAGEEVEIKSFNTSNGVLVVGTKDQTSNPKVIVTQVNTMPVQVSPGSTFDLNFSVTNTNLEKAIRNIKMTLSSVDPVSQKAYIIPVGQSDSLFVASLESGEVSDQTIKLMLPANFTNQICDIKIAFTYEDKDGKPLTDEESIHLPVAERVELTASDVRIGKVLEDSYSLELDFYNTGKGVLKNLMVDLQGDFQSTNSNYFVGDLQAGKMDIYSVNITGEIPAAFKGEVVFTYEDGLGQKIEKKVPFDLKYEKVVDKTAEELAAEAAAAAPKPSGVNPMVIGGGVIVVAIIAFVIYRMRKRKAA